jgi:hypothetical protein
VTFAKEQKTLLASTAGKEAESEPWEKLCWSLAIKSCGAEALAIWCVVIVAPEWPFTVSTADEQKCLYPYQWSTEIIDVKSSAFVGDFATMVSNKKT